jgi:hypothetical protein
VDVSYYGILCKPLPTEFSKSSQIATPIVPPSVTVPVFLSATEAASIYWHPPWTSPYSSFKKISPSALIAGSILAYDGEIDMSQVSALTHENLAARLKQDKKFDEALAETETAEQIAPNRPEPHRIRSATLASMGKRAEAASEINKASSMENALAASR